MVIPADNKSNSKSKNQNENTSKINVKLNKGVTDESVKSKSNSKKIDNNADNDNQKQKIKSKDNIITIIIVEKTGSLKEVDINDEQVCVEELSKKCKFKKVDGFLKRTTWKYNSSKNKDTNCGSKITIELWAKDDGIANHENKYEFPPPVDTDLYFGACALVARDGKNNYISLSKDKWNKIYEYLFGGFESLVTNNGQDDDDDDEEDELASIPKNKKTRDGYLKDGFVVDGGAVCDSDIDAPGNGDVSDDIDTSDDDSDEDSDDGSDDGNDKSCNSGSDDEGDGGGEGEGNTDRSAAVYCDKKNRNMLTKGLHHNIVSKSKSNPKDKNSIIAGNKHSSKYDENDDDDNSGWNTDESSELSEEEYSYSK